MVTKNHMAHARVTAICVNLALDAVEADIRRELDNFPGDGSEALSRVLTKLNDRRLSHNVVENAGRC